jgi:amino acid adenylation domain-containing protein/non-ribosomal peptide synthase protein (TIGR01720 family)
LAKEDFLIGLEAGDGLVGARLVPDPARGLGQSLAALDAALSPLSTEPDPVGPASPLPGASADENSAEAAGHQSPERPAVHLDVLVVGESGTEVGPAVTCSLQAALAPGDPGSPQAQTAESTPAWSVLLDSPDGTYSEGQLRVLGWHLAALAAAVIADPALPLGQVSLVRQAEWDLIAERNATPPPLAPGQCIHDLVSATATRLPDSIAAVQGERQVTFAQLEAMANSLARHLRQLGVGRGDRVGLMPVRGVELIAAMVGVMRAGAAFVPLSPRFPAQRIDHMLTESGARWLCVGDPSFEFGPNGIVRVDLSDPATWSAASDPVESVNVPTDHAAIIYTSGTTGLPKGVMIRHDTVVSYGEFNHHHWPLTDHDVITQFAPFTFSTAILEITAALFSGARLICVSDAQIGDPRAFIGAMMTTGVTVVLAPPEYAAYLVPTPTLRIVETGASVCRPEVAAKFAGKVWHANAYGLTECSVPLVWPGTSGPIPARIPIGRPVPGTSVYILRGTEQCGLYMPGEICVTGIAVADGYLNLPEAEAQRFVPNPFGSGRMVRTGDIGQWNADGDIEYLGRADNQVQIRGQRVELDEVERAIARLSQVAQVAAIAREDSRGETEIVAFVAASEELDLAALRRELVAGMVPYMVPSRLLAVPSIPLTVNGKPDKRALGALLAQAEREADGDGEAGADDGGAEAGGAQLIAEVFGEVLEHAIGLDDDFFAEGGHSLRAVRAINLIEERTGVRLPIESLFEAPTPRALADRLAGAAGAYRPIGSAGGPGTYPMSSAQRRLFVLEEMDAAGITYNIPASVELTGEVDVEKIQAAWSALVERHEALRTSFFLRDGQAWQHIAKAAAAEVELIDVPDLAPATRQGLVEAFCRPFDLASAPLARLAVVRTGGENNLLLFDMHHIVSDGTSMKTILAEFARLYEGQTLEPVAAQYKDYAAWLAERDTAIDREYWMGRINADQEFAVVTPDHPRPAAQGFRGASVASQLPASLRGAVEGLAARSGTTEYMVLLAALMVLIARYGGTELVHVGSPISTRTHREVEGTVGLFINTLVMTAKARGDQTFAQFLDEIRGTVLGALEHRDYPFEDLVADAAPRRDLGRNPLFDVCLTVQNYEEAHAELTGVALREVPVAVPVAKFDLSLTVTPQPDGSYTLDTEYAVDLYREETACYFARHFTALVRAAVLAPDTPLADLDPVDDAERRLVLESFSGAGLAPGQVGPTPGACAPVGDIAPATVQVLDRLAEDPEAAAIVGVGGLALTRRELVDPALQLAGRLRELGVGPGAMVAVCADRRPEMIRALLAVVFAGGAYVTIDPDHPAARVRAILDQARPVAILLAGASLPAQPADPAVPILDVTDSGLYSGPVPPAPSAPSPDDPVYCVFTSGTTGQPKGVVITHRNLAACLASATPDELLPEREPVFSFSANYCFDAATYHIWVPLTRGWPMALADERDLTDQASFAAFAAETRPGIVDLTPTQAEFYSADPLRRAWLAGVSLWLGGEVLTPPLAGRLLEAGARLANQYGPAETTVAVTSGLITDPNDITIGRTIPGSEVYVVDAPGGPAGSHPRGPSEPRPVGLGMPGEIWIAGANVAAGYLGDPELSARHFIANPFGPGRCYRTGDIGAWRPDGRLEFLGRLDGQVKLRGQRLELDDIKAAFVCAAGVTEAAVAVVDINGEPALAAFVVADEDIDLIAVRVHVAGLLPRHMVPASIARVDAIPRAGTGKVDVRALAHLARPAPVGLTAPRDRIEEALASAFAAELGLERVGVEDDFFALGGHSLRAAALAGRIREALGATCSLRDILSHPTVAELADLIRVGSAEPPAPLAHAGGAGTWPMTSAQRRLYALAQVDSAGLAYNQPAAFEVGRLDADRLERAFARLVDRHEALRTSLGVDDAGTLVQRVAAPGQVAGVVERGTVDELDAGNYPRLIDEFIRPFDLSHAPLARLRLIQDQSANRGLLLVDSHHAAVDGLSLDRLVGELASLYDGRALDPVRYSATDWAAHLATRDAAADAEYWSGVFGADGPTAELPTDWSRGAEQRFEGAAIVRPLPAELVEPIAAVARTAGATQFGVLLAAIAAVVARYGRADGVALGTVASGRSHPDAEEIVGMLVGTVPLRLNAAPTTPFVQAVAEAAEVLLAASEHADLPFEKIVALAGGDRDGSRNPLFDVCVVLEPDTMSPPRFDGVDARTVPIPRRIAKFDLTLSIRRVGGLFEVEAEYRTGLFAPETIEVLLHHLEVFLTEACRAPELRLGQIPLVDADEHALLVGAAAGHGEPWQPATIPELFAAQVAAQPDAVAIEAEHERVTYAELAQRALRIRDGLGALGVGRGDYVALSLPRGIALQAAILGVLQAGAAWVPLDPADPVARRSGIAADCGAKVLIHDGAPAGPAGVVRLNLATLEADGAARASNGSGVSGADRAEPGGPDDVAYCLYTSGSTGQPKGVEVRHLGVAHLVQTLFMARWGVGPGDQVLAFANPVFDGSVWEWAMALLTGASLRIVPAERVDDLDWLNATVADGVTVATLPPIMAVRVAAEPLRLLISAGSTAQPVEGYSGMFVNGYGPTETTVCATLWQRPAGQTGYPRPIPIGTPVPNFRAYVVDDQMALTGLRVPGELVVAGPGLARGYLGREDLTAVAFPSNPFGPGRCYRTGDLVRWGAGGQLEFLGRVDSQVKVRGVRVEPGEVEAQLRTVPGIAAVAVVLRPGPDGADALVAYVVPQAPGGIVPSEIRVALADALPTSMVPSYIEEVPDLPLNQSGKLDVAALPPVRARADADHVPPEGAVEEAIAAAFAHTLGVDGVGASDDFFALGGDSIKAIGAVAYLRESGWETSVRDILSMRTVRAVAARTTPAGQGPTVDQEPVVGPIRLTPIGRRFLATPRPDPGHYNQHVFLTGHFEPTAMQRALDAVVRHHDMLRATFPDGVAQIAAPGEATIRLTLADWPESNPAPEAIERRCAAVQRSFDLGHGPLAAAMLHRTPERDHLLIVAHHLVVDAVSWRVIVQDLLAAYRQVAAGQPIALPPKTASLDAWARAVEHLSAGAVGQRDYWVHAADAGLPLGPPTGSRERARAWLDAPATADLLADAHRAYSTEPVELILAGVATALGETFGARQVSLDYESHGRDYLALPVERTVGWFTALHPLRLGVTGEWEATIVGVKETLRQVPMAGLGYGALVEAGLLDLPASGCCFNYLGVEHQGVDLSGWPVGPDIDPGAPPEYALLVTARITGGRLELALDHATRELTDDAGGRLAERMVQAVKDVIGHCRSRRTAVQTASDFDIALGGDELDRLNRLVDGL